MRALIGWVERLCPHCERPIRFADLLETVRCPWCRQSFHPEHALPYPRTGDES